MKPQSATQKAISTIENAGKYLVTSRDLRAYIVCMTATEAAHSPNPDLQAFAVLSVLLARITGVRGDGWVSEIEKAVLQ